MTFKNALVASSFFVALAGTPAARAQTDAATTAPDAYGENRPETEGAYKSAPEGTQPDAAAVKAKAATKAVKKTAGKATKAVKTAGHKVAKGAKTVAHHPVKSAKVAGGKVAKGAKSPVAGLKVAAARCHDAAVARGRANDAAHAPCSREVTEKSGNAVGNPCLTSAAYAHSLGVKQKQVAKVRSAKATKATAKKRATH